MKSLRTIRRALLFFVHLLIGGVLTLIIGLFQRKDRRQPSPELVQWWHRRLCNILRLNIRVHGELPKEPVFIVSNHISWLDIPVFGTLGQISFVAKSEVRAWPLIGWLSARAGTLFIRRGAGQTEALKQQMLEKLDQGSHVLLFPEGTTTDGSSVRSFFPRLFALAQESGHAIQPLALRFSQAGTLCTASPYIDDALLLPHFFGVVQQDVIDVDIFITEPLSASDTDRKTLAKLTHGAIVSALNGNTIGEVVTPDDLSQADLA